MQLSNSTRKRWVINDIDVETVRSVRTLAARHQVRMAEVVDRAVEQLEERLYHLGELPDGWREY